MRITLLIPCHNEENAIRKSIQSWLGQTRPPDEIIVVDDSSTDSTPDILKEYEGQLTAVKTPKNLGNKSHAQEYGLQFVTGDIFIASDADTILQSDFIEKIAKDFEDPAVVAVGGYVKSLKYNWLTRHRAFEYSIGQNFHKLAQSYINFMFVIPGAAGAFRTDIFRKYLSFDHDSITEDLDFTYKLHKRGLKVHYNREAIVYTQDPSTLSCYMNQMRRWFGGGWQNLMKHHDIARLRPMVALELSLMYIEGFIFSIVMLLIPILNIRFALLFMIPYFFVSLGMSIIAAVKERRADLVLACFPYILFLYVNAYLFVEQFVLEVVLRKQHRVWFTPKRVSLV